MSRSESAQARRVAAVCARTEQLELDGILVTHLANVRYLTGFSGSNGWLLVGPNRAIFATDGRYEAQAGEELASDVDFELLVLRDGLLPEMAKRAAAEFDGKRLGFEGRRLSFVEWSRLEEIAAPVHWVAAEDVVEGIRAVKDPDELSAIEKSADIATAALEETLASVRLGIAELEIAAELDYRMSRNGSEGPAFETIVASGPRSALPHASSGDRRVAEGDLLLCDFGARWRGYCSDITRTFVLGSPSPRQAEVYEAILAAQAAATAALTVGARAGDVDRAAREVFDARALGGQFPHSTGHGLGLEIHEGPRLHGKAEERLEADVVVTVEPGLYFQGWGGVRIEDDLVVTEGGPRSLVQLPKDNLRSLPI